MAVMAPNGSFGFARVDAGRVHLPSSGLRSAGSAGRFSHMARAADAAWAPVGSERAAGAPPDGPGGTGATLPPCPEGALIRLDSSC